MALGDPYVSVEEVVEYAQIRDSSDDARVEQVTRAVTGLIIGKCGRDFNDAGSATARVYVPTNTRVVIVDDFSSNSGLVVKTDTSADGTYLTTIPASSFTLWPYNGHRHGRVVAYERILLNSSDSFPVCGVRPPSVQVTAPWGWGSFMPAEVKEAALIQCARVFGRRHSVNGVIGQGDFVFRVPTQLDPDVALLLEDLRRDGTVG